MIHFTHVTKSYEKDWKALNNVTFRINKGEFVFLTGHSGAGKSTVLKLIYMDERPDEERGGQVMVKFTGDTVYDSKTTPEKTHQSKNALGPRLEPRTFPNHQPQLTYSYGLDPSP